MNLASAIWRWGSGIVIGLLMIGYVATLLVHNYEQLYRTPPHPELDQLSDKLLSATGTTQRWNMFAPNVGDFSYSPVVVIVMKDDSRVALHSIVEPDTPNWTEPFLMPHDASTEARRYSWRFHFGDGRIRKYESRAASADFGWWRIRTEYTRKRASDWIAANPNRKAEIKRIELWRVMIRHPGLGDELSCESTEVMNIDPQAIRDRWPVQIDPYYPFYSR